MKTSVIVPLLAAALLATAATASSAQNTAGAKDQAGQSATGTQSNPVVETTGQAPAGQKVQVHDEALAKDQPLTATGEDLKGPPKQFAPSQTPE